MADWEIVWRIEDPDRYAACAENLAPLDQDAGPLDGAFGRRMFESYLPPYSVLDASFALCHRGRPAALVEALLDPFDRLTRNGEPLRLVLQPTLGAQMGPAIEQLLACLVGAVTSLPKRPDFLEIEDSSIGNFVTPLGLAVLKRGGHPMLAPWPVLDLTQPEDALWRALRPSSRQNIKWGERHLDLGFFNREETDPAVFAATVAVLAEQGPPLPPATAAFYREWFEAGRGEAILIRHEGRGVGVVFAIDEGETCLYAVGRYDTAPPSPGGGRPAIAHWPLWTAIRRAQARGRRRFELYRIFFRGQERPGYRFGTAHFKLGFTTALRQRIVWRIPVEGTALGRSRREGT